MSVLRSDIERALDEIISQEEGMRFQGLAVVLGKQRWPELIARQRKKDLGLDAYASPTETPDKVGKGLAASITATLAKVSGDAKEGKENFPSLDKLLFVTPRKVGNAARREWEQTIREAHGIELFIIEREEIITLMMMPGNASLRASFLNLEVDAGPQLEDLLERTRRAANTTTKAWARSIAGEPLIELTAVRLDPNGAESADALSLERIEQALCDGARIVLEGPAGRGKTTTLIQLAQNPRTAWTRFLVDLPAWTFSGLGVLEYIAGTQAFQAERLTAADLASVLQAVPFLLLLNGWNEVAEANSERARVMLRQVECDFPTAGIAVATRAHHVTPPLPRALRLRLSRLRRAERAKYLAARLGPRGGELVARIEANRSLDELTLTPLILAEVASLFEANAGIPTTKMGILEAVLRVHEQRHEHFGALQAAPMSGVHGHYLQALATTMVRDGAVAVPDATARSVVAACARDLAQDGQIAQVDAPTILHTLTAHHVLEPVDYPERALRFEHQQLQEYYAALDVRERLLHLSDADGTEKVHFAADYVNDPAWAESLRMIAAAFAEQTESRKVVAAGRKLVTMALAVDLAFAGELAQLCGPAVWKEVRTDVSDRLRSVYALADVGFQTCALASMIATGSDDFNDIVVPLLSAPDQQTRLRTYRLWPEMRISSLGMNWRQLVRGWSEDARADLVSEVLRSGISVEDVAAFAAMDDSAAVKRAAISSLIWARSDEVLSAVLDSADAATFEAVACEHAARMPAVFRSRTIGVLRRVLETSTDSPRRLRTALDLIQLGEEGLFDPVRSAMEGLEREAVHSQGPRTLRTALEWASQTNPTWASEWTASRIADGVLYPPEEWLPLATSIPDRLVEQYLERLETEDLGHGRIDGMVKVISARADVQVARRLFTKLRDLQRAIDAAPDERHEFARQVMRQLEDMFRGLPDDVAVAGVMASVVSGDALDLAVATGLLSRVARSDREPLRVADDGLKARIRAYLRDGVDVVHRRDDFDGSEKAHLASVISQVGDADDMALLVGLVRADVERLDRGRVARAAREDGPVTRGASHTYAHWHISAVIRLDPRGADQVLCDFLSEPEYTAAVAAAMAQDFLPKSERTFGQGFRFDLMWAARDGRPPPALDEPRRRRFAVALNSEIKRLKHQPSGGKATYGVGELATALAAIDGFASAPAVLELIAMPGEWDHHARVVAAERLLVAGVVLPATTTFSLVGSVVERITKCRAEADKYLLLRALCLLPFVDDPAGISKMRDLIGDLVRNGLLWGHEMGEIFTALGESRSDAALDLLCHLAADWRTLEHCEDKFVAAVAAVGVPRAHALLLGFVDPEAEAGSLPRLRHRGNVLAALLGDLARRTPQVAERLLQLCARDLPEPKRRLLSKVMNAVGTSEALHANLNLIGDDSPTPVPEGVWEQIESAFVERRPYGGSPNTFAVHAHASNDIRSRLFEMAMEDPRRKRAALGLLGQVELWRLERGRPMDEPRHPSLGSGEIWPPDCSRVGVR